MYLRLLFLQFPILLFIILHLCPMTNQNPQQLRMEGKDAGGEDGTQVIDTWGFLFFLFFYFFFFSISPYVYVCTEISV